MWRVSGNELSPLYLFLFSPYLSITAFLEGKGGEPLYCFWYGKMKLRFGCYYGFITLYFTVSCQFCRQPKLLLVSRFFLLFFPLTNLAVKIFQSFLWMENKYSLMVSGGCCTPIHQGSNPRYDIPCACYLFKGR